MRQLYLGDSLVGTVVGVTALLTTYLVMILVLGLSQEDRMVIDRLFGKIRMLIPKKRYGDIPGP
jgi:hypothetical protein